MGRLRLTLAAWDYDRVRPLFDGTIQPEGIENQLKPQEIADLFAYLLTDRPPGEADGQPLGGNTKDPP